MTTFSIDDICFLDTETKQLVGSEDVELKDDGTYRYMQGAKVIILTYAIGMGPVQIVTSWTSKLSFTDLPPDLRQFYRRAASGAAWFAAWNAGFDKCAWNIGMIPVDFAIEIEDDEDTPMQADMIIDIMAQAVASNLPPSLEGASKFIGRDGKQGDGKALIKLFCGVTGGTPETHPIEWARFQTYAKQDIDELRQIFLSTRQLPMAEWEEYWAAERVNERGMAVDLPFCRKAAAVNVANAARVNAELKALTGGVVTKVTQHARIANWLWDNMREAEAQNILVTDFTKEEAEGEEDEIEIVKVSAKRELVTRAIAFYAALERPLDETEQRVLRVLQLREFGASAAPGKFQKMLDQQVGGRLYGQYVFNGAGQTGRFSAKGVQVHNMTRDVIGKDGVDEAAAIEMINDLEI